MWVVSSQNICLFPPPGKIPTSRLRPNVYSPLPHRVFQIAVKKGGGSEILLKILPETWKFLFSGGQIKIWLGRRGGRVYQGKFFQVGGINKFSTGGGLPCPIPPVGKTLPHTPPPPFPQWIKICRLPRYNPTKMSFLEVKNSPQQNFWLHPHFTLHLLLLFGWKTLTYLVWCDKV